LSSENDTLLTAVNPPKRLLSSRTDNSALSATTDAAAQGA
jgi:hypothetical protein